MLNFACCFDTIQGIMLLGILFVAVACAQKYYYPHKLARAPNGITIRATMPRENYKGRRFHVLDQTAYFVVLNGSELFSIATRTPELLPFVVTSFVERFDGLFHGLDNFNEDISAWDVSRAVSMKETFRGAKAFNGNISAWDVSRVESMEGMFWNARAFDGDISAWNVSAVKTMRSMFRETWRFNSRVDKWNTQSVTDVSHMFRNARRFNQPVSSWDTRSLKHVECMLCFASAFEQNLSGWNRSVWTGLRFNSFSMFEWN